MSWLEFKIGPLQHEIGLLYGLNVVFSWHWDLLLCSYTLICCDDLMKSCTRNRAPAKITNPLCSAIKSQSWNPSKDDALHCKLFQSAWQVLYMSWSLHTSNASHRHHITVCSELMHNWLNRPIVVLTNWQLSPCSIEWHPLARCLLHKVAPYGTNGHTSIVGSSS